MIILFLRVKIDGYCCTQSLIDADIQHLYQEARLPLGKHFSHFIQSGSHRSFKSVMFVIDE